MTDTKIDGKITVFLADDNLIVREGVRALLGEGGIVPGNHAFRPIGCFLRDPPMQPHCV